MYNLILNGSITKIMQFSLKYYLKELVQSECVVISGVNLN
jgi:hypothetical protein